MQEKLHFQPTRRSLSWRSWDAVQQYLLGPHFQLGLQLAVAILLTSLPSFVRALSFPHACFSPVLMVIGLVSMSPDGHVGTKLLAAYQLLGQAWLGAITAGVMASIALLVEPLSHRGYIAALCFTSSAGIGLLTSARAGPAAITLWPNITVSCLNFSVVMLWSLMSHSLGEVWQKDVGGMLLCGCTAALAVMVAARLVLPTLATEEVVQLTSAAVRGAGHSLSRYLSLLLDTQSARHTQQQQPASERPQADAHHAAALHVAQTAAPAGGTSSNSKRLPQHQPVDVGLQCQHDQQHQAGVPLPGPHAPMHLHQRHQHPHVTTPSGRVSVLGPSVDELRSVLLRASTTLSKGMYEPLGAGGCGMWRHASMDLWKELLAAAERLISVVSTLQGVLVYASPRIMQPMTASFSTLAAFSSTASAVIGLTISSTAALAEALLQPTASAADLSRSLSVADGSWLLAKAQLRAAQAAALRHYWSSTSSNKERMVAASKDALAVTFVTVAAGGVMTAVERLDQVGSKLWQETYTPAAPCNPVSCKWGADGASSNRDCTIFPEQLVSEGDVEAPRTSDMQQQQQKQQQQPHACHKQSMLAVLKAMLLWSMLSNIAGFWSTQLHKLLSVAACTKQPGSHSSTGRRALLHCLQHDRSAAAAFKLWLGMSLLVALIILVAENPHSSINPMVAMAVMHVPTHGVIALVLAWHERVESTLIRVLLRIAGTAVGGTVGWAANRVTSDPVVLLLIMCSFGMVLAPLAAVSFHLRLATALMVISMLVVVLCQYDIPSEHTHATNAFLGTRLIEVTIACCWAAIFNNLLLPWTSRDWSVEQLSSALTAAAGVFNRSSQLHFQAVPAAVTAGVPVSVLGTSPSNGTGKPAPSQLAAALKAEELALQKTVVEPVVAVQTAVGLETQVWHQWSAPTAGLKQLKTLVRDMLQLADRITAVQVAVAGLPESVQPSSTDTSSGRTGALHSSHVHGPDPQGIEPQSARIITSQLMQPLHESHLDQLRLISGVGAAVRLALLEPSAPAQRHLRILIKHLADEQQRSDQLVARLRMHLHHDAILQYGAPPGEQPHSHTNIPGTAGLHQPQEAQPQPQQPHGPGEDVDLKQHLVTDLSAAMDGVLVGTEGSSIPSNTSAGSTSAEHASSGWWLHAGAHYCQLLAFQYALDAAVAGFLQAANTALTLSQ